MKMKWLGIALIVAVVVLAALLPGMAAAAPGKLGNTRPISDKPTLVVTANVSVMVGEPITIQVSNNNTEDGVARAQVWAVSVERIPSVSSNIDEDMRLVKRYGKLLGITNKKGDLQAGIKKEGEYLLVAVRPGYISGFTEIMITARQELLMRAPGLVKLGQVFSLQVVQKSIATMEPVEDAEVWAVSANSTAPAKLTAELAKQYGFLLGTTNGTGYIVDPQTKLDKPGSYRLVAFGDGFVPAFAKIVVAPVPSVTAATKPPKLSPTETPFKTPKPEMKNDSLGNPNPKGPSANPQGSRSKAPEDKNDKSFNGKTKVK